MEAIYKCNMCKTETLFKKKYGDHFPAAIHCEHCNSADTYRVYEPLHTEVRAGYVGNAKNGYSSKPGLRKK